WATAGFADGAWRAATNGVGYEQSVPGFMVKNYKANVLVGGLAAADAVIATPSQQANVYTANRDVIDYFNSGSPGHYPQDNPFPGFDVVTDQEDFVVEVTATV